MKKKKIYENEIRNLDNKVDKLENEIKDIKLLISKLGNLFISFK